MACHWFYYNISVQYSSNIDFTTYAGEHFIKRHTGGGSFVLPAGYRMYHVKGSITYSGSSSNSAINVQTTNYTGKSWYRRIEERDDGNGGYSVVPDQFERTDGVVLCFGSGVALTTSGGGVTFDMTVTRHDTHMYLITNFHHTGANSSGLSTGEVVLNDFGGDIPLTLVPSSSSRTFSDADFVISGVKNTN